MKPIEITLHKDQERAIFSKRRFTYMISGIQGGKTMAGGVWTRKRITEVPAKNTNFLVTAPSHKIMTQATFPTFIKYHQGMGKYNKAEGIFEMPNKRRIYLRTFSDGKNPRAVEGITDLEGIWNDEVGMLNLECAINLEARSSFRQCPMFNSTTPYSLNWLYKNIYKPWKAGQRDDIELVQFESINNPFFPKAEFERQKRLLDPRVFAMKYCGQFERMAGLVYADISPDNYCPFPDHLNQRDWEVYGGLDFGYMHPFAMVIRAMHRDDPLDIQIDEHRQSFLNTSQIIELCLKTQDKYNVAMFYADSAQPQTIADLQRAGVRVMAVVKGPDSIKNGIIAHNALIRSREHKLVTGRNPQTEDEYATYHYQEDQGGELLIKDIPVDANNHCMDATRYVTLMTKEFRLNRIERRTPKLGKGDLQKLIDGDPDPWEEESVGDWYNE